MRYTWDTAKATKVARDHKVEFAKLEDLFRDPFAIEFADHSHSSDEKRFAIIGLTAAYGLIFLVFTEVSENEIRFITARKPERWMVNDYEENRRGR